MALKPADPRVAPGPIDYSEASEVTIDLSLEYPGLNGTMTVAKKEIKEIRKLQNLDPQTMKRIILADLMLDEQTAYPSERRYGTGRGWFARCVRSSA